MYKLTAADFADTGQWRLLLKICYTGLEAFLENTLHEEIEPQLLCNARWDLNRDMLRNNIEEAVYSNPRLLDDFATRIILYDPRTLFIPTDVAEESTGAEEEIYKKVYTAEDCDIMTDSDRDLTAAWEMAPGVKSFLLRTFPGARITSNLMNLVKDLRKENSGLTLHAMARPEEVDIILLEGKNLMSASTHEWTHTDDIAFLMLNVLEVYGVKLSESSIEVEGVATETEAWKYIGEHAASFRNKD